MDDLLQAFLAQFVGKCPSLQTRNANWSIITIESLSGKSPTIYVRRPRAGLGAPKFLDN
jgi:hypothetical protein